MDPNDLVTVYTAANSVDATIVKNALEDQGIRCFVEGGNQAAETGLIGIPVTVAVAAKDADEARQFVLLHKPHHPQEPDRGQ
jgi:hypothetical protein